MTDAKSAWTDAGEKLQGLGATLKQHYDQQRGDDAGQTRQQVGDAFEKVGEALRGAFDALGAAAKDPAVKADVKSVGASVTEALGATFSAISEDFRTTFDLRKGDVTPDAATSEGTPGAAGAESGPAGTASQPAGPAADPPGPPEAEGEEPKDPSAQI